MTDGNLRPDITDAIGESGVTVDAVIYKIADEVQHIKTVTVEPGAEIARGLLTVIDGTIKDSVSSGCDLSVVTKGILIGAFSSSHSIQLEAHKTIRLLVQEILQPIFKYNGDSRQAVDGLLAAMVIIAKRRKFNIQEALIIIVDDILFSAEKIDPKFAEKVKICIPKEYNGFKVMP